MLPARYDDDDDDDDDDCSWDLYTTGQLKDGLQKKKKKRNAFKLNGNGIMSSFLGR